MRPDETPAPRPPPLPTAPQWPRLAALSSPIAGLVSILLFVIWVKVTDRYLLTPNLTSQLLGGAMLVVLLAGLAAAVYSLASRRLFGSPGLFILAIIGLALNVIAGLMWVFPATTLSYF